MKRVLALAVLAAATMARAQAVDTTVCDILKNPTAFNGKTVRVKGTVVAGFDQFVIRGADCGQRVDAIWLDYPEGTKAKSGPAAVLELQTAKNSTETVTAAGQAAGGAAPTLDAKSKDFKQFDSLLAAQWKGNGMCLGCAKNMVTATLTGRLDAVVNAMLRRNDAGKLIGFDGFGNLNAYNARLVIESVADVSAQPIDYSKAATASKDEQLQEAGGDALGQARKLGSAFGDGNQFGAQITRAADAFGKQGDNNGVIVNFGGGNEAAAKSEGKGAADSPDGVLYNCFFDMGKLKGDQLSRAMVYLGAHVADLRQPPSGFENAGVYEIEYRGLTTMAVMTIGAHQKTLTLTGGTLLWNDAWPTADRDNQLNAAITAFLNEQELLTR
jgi:hypothetical protein